MENGLVKVVSPIDDTPAYKAGIESGDFITHIDGEPVMGLSLSEAVEKMRGPVDSKIELRLVPQGQGRAVRRQPDPGGHQDLAGAGPQSRATSPTSGSPPSTSRPAPRCGTSSRSSSGKIGDKIPGLVLDLRNNPGGLLDQAVAVADAFIDKGEIVSTRGRRPETIQRFNARPGDIARRHADGGADQRRLGLGLRDRGRRAAGPSPRHRHGHPVVRQGLGADHHADLGRRRHPADHRALLHAVRPLDPGQGHHARHRGPPGQGGGPGRRPRAAARPTCAAGCRTSS